MQAKLAGIAGQAVLHLGPGMHFEGVDLFLYLQMDPCVDIADKNPHQLCERKKGDSCIFVEVPTTVEAESIIRRLDWFKVPGGRYRCRWRWTVAPRWRQPTSLSQLLPPLDWPPTVTTVEKIEWPPKFKEQKIEVPIAAESSAVVTEAKAGRNKMPRTGMGEKKVTFDDHRIHL